MYKKFYLLIGVVGLIASSCITSVETRQQDDALPPPLIETSGAVTAIVPSLAPTDVPLPEIELSFESQTYLDEEGRFELLYPIDWNVGYSERQSRGYFKQLVSWDISESDSIEFRPDGGTYVQITVYTWEPLNDLDAYMAQRLPSWETSGWEVVDLEELQVDGNSAVMFTLESPVGEAPVFFFWMVLGDRYLELNGQGDFSILEEIVQSIQILESVE